MWFTPPKNFLLRDTTPVFLPPGPPFLKGGKKNFLGKGNFFWRPQEPLKKLFCAHLPVSQKIFGHKSPYRVVSPISKLSIPPNIFNLIKKPPPKFPIKLVKNFRMDKNLDKCPEPFLRRKKMVGPQGPKA